MAFAGHLARPSCAGEAGGNPALPRSRDPGLVSRNACHERFSTRRGLRVTESVFSVLEFAARPSKGVKVRS